MNDTSAPQVPESGAPATGLPRHRLVLLFAVTMVSASGNTALQSIMPAIGAALGVGDVWISLAFSWSALLWMVCAPYWARRSDRRGRKAMMLLGVAGFAASMLSCALFLHLGLSGTVGGFTTLLLFMAGRSLYGLFGSAAPPAVQAYVASRTAPELRVRTLSLVASSFGLGTVIGPALAPLLVIQGLGLAGPCLSFFAIGLAVAIALRLVLPDDSPTYAARGQVVSEPYGQGVERLEAGTGEEAAPARLGWLDPRVRPWTVPMALGVHAQAMITGIAGFLVLDRLGLRGDPETATGAISLVMMAGALATLVAQWGLIPNLRLDARQSSLWGLASAAAGVGLLSIGQDLHGLALGYAVASLGFGLFRPGTTAGASLAARREEQGAVAGIGASIAGSAFVVTPAIGVWLYGHVPALGFGAVEVLCLVAALVGAAGMKTVRAD